MLGGFCDTEGVWISESFGDLGWLEGGHSPGVFCDSFSMSGAGS